MPVCRHPAPVRDSVLPRRRGCLSFPFNGSRCLRNPVSQPLLPSPWSSPGHRTDLTDDCSKLMLPRHLQACPWAALRGRQGFSPIQPSTRHSPSPSCSLHRIEIRLPNPNRSVLFNPDSNKIKTNMDLLKKNKHKSGAGQSQFSF